MKPGGREGAGTGFLILVHVSSGSGGLENSGSSKGPWRSPQSQLLTTYVNKLRSTVAGLQARPPGQRRLFLSLGFHQRTPLSGIFLAECLSYTGHNGTLYSDWLMQAQVLRASKKSCLLVPEKSPHLTQTSLFASVFKKGLPKPHFLCNSAPPPYPGLAHPAPTQVYPEVLLPRSHEGQTPSLIFSTNIY